MGIEIERKFLVKGNQWKELTEGIFCKQGYLSTNKEPTVRVRIIGVQAFLTIKGINKNMGISRAEYEYEIPLNDATEMLEQLCRQPLIEKHRYKIVIDELTWEIDEFHGDNEGLILAEVELESENQNITLPDWIDREVSGDPRYFNANLTSNPYKMWM